MQNDQGFARHSNVMRGRGSISRRRGRWKASEGVRRVLKQTKDISDLEVCRAYAISKLGLRWPYDILMEMTGAPEKVCYRAMERASERGFIEYGMTLRSGWLTEKGKTLIEENRSPSDNLRDDERGLK
jgi:hypothetical protein